MSPMPRLSRWPELAWWMLHAPNANGKYGVNVSTPEMNPTMSFAFRDLK